MVSMSTISLQIGNMDGISTQEQQALILSVGTHRVNRPFSPLEVAHVLRKAIDHWGGVRSCSETLGIGSTQIRTFLRLLDLTPEIQHLADWRGSQNASVSFSSLAELARLRPDDQVQATKAVLRHRMTWKEVVGLVQILERSGRSAADAIEDVLKLRPQIETRHLFVGSIGADETRYAIDCLPQSERDKLMARTLQALVGADYQATGRLGPSHFTILSLHDMSSFLGLEPDALEVTFNKMLDQRLKE